MRKLVKLQRVLGVVLLVTLMASSLYAGPGGGGGQRGQRGQRGQQDQQGQRGERGTFDRASMQERMVEMMKERLGATDEEWVVIKPRLSEVMTLSMNARGTRGMRGRGRGNRDQQETEAPTEPLQIATADLQTTLDKEAPTAAEIKAKLTALRGAREKNKQKMVTAQQKLKEVLTVKQEAVLVMMSLLE